jgi:ABC-type sugar transport system permease subunit
MYQTVLAIIYGLQTLVTPILLTPGAGGSGGMSISTVPVRDNYFFMVHVYQESFNRLRFGYGSALLWIMFVFILILTLFLTRISKAWVYYEVDPDSKPGE